MTRRARTRVWLLGAVLALTVVPAGPAFAVPKVSGIFDLPGVQTNGQLAVGPDGNVWVSLEQAVGRVKPDGAATPLTTGGLADTLGFPTGGIAVAGGFVWVSQQAGAGQETIVKIPPGNPAGAEGVAVPGVDAGTTAMTTGPDGNVWVGLPGKLIEFSPANPAAATPHDIPGVVPRAIAPAPDGTLWMTDPGTGHLWNVPTTGQFVLTGLDFGGQPQFLGVSPAGQVAFGNPTTDPQRIGLVRLHDPAQQYQPIDRPNGSDPFGVTFGADGAFWIAEFAGNRLARVTPGGELTTLGGLPVVAGQGPRQITAGPGNTLWATLDKPGDAGATKIARITGVDPAPTPATGGGTPSDPIGGGPPPPLAPLRYAGLEGISINGGADYTNDPGVTLSVRAPLGAAQLLISNDGGFAGASTLPVNQSGRYRWRLRSTGQERLPKVVYLRFIGALGIDVKTFTDDIILDRTRPRVTAVAFEPPSPRAGNASLARSRYVRVRGSDNLSGIGGVQLAANRSKPGRLLKPAKQNPRSRSLNATFRAPAGKRLWVRAIDRAGNSSSWRAVTR